MGHDVLERCGGTGLVIDASGEVADAFASGGHFVLCGLWWISLSGSCGFRLSSSTSSVGLSDAILCLQFSRSLRRCRYLLRRS